MLIEGKCHCGNIAFTFDWPGDAGKEPAQVPARACGCTFCLKHGGVWTSNPKGRLDVKVRDPARVNEYQFGTRTATFHVCTVCGNVPFVTSVLDGHLYAVVNVNLFENLDATQVVRGPADFEGEDLATRLARRKRGWIPEVRIGR